MTNLYKLHIGEGNIKMGAIPSFSLLPGTTCSAAALGTCFNEGCYARRMIRFRKTVCDAYTENTELVLSNVESFERHMNGWLASHMAVVYMRVHVSGDFVTKEYAKAWARIAMVNPNVKFLAFTKQFDNIHGIDFPDNFQIVLSAWPGIEVPSDLRKKYHVAWMDDGRGTIPEDAKPCSGHCNSCMKCWSLSSDVIFKKH